MSTEPFKLDMVALDTVCGGYGTGGEAASLVGELARQLCDHGAPSAPLEEQLRVLLASRLAMQQAGEEMPSDRQVAVAWWGAKPQDNEFPAQGSARAVLALFAPIVARLTQERDEAQLAARRWADDVRNLRQCAERAEADLTAVQNDRANYKRALSDTQRALVDARARIAELESRHEPSADMVECVAAIAWNARSVAMCKGRPNSAPVLYAELDEPEKLEERAYAHTVISALAEMGEEVWPTPDDGREALRQRDGFYMEGARGVSATVIGLCRSRLAPVIGALRARVAELEAKLSRVSKAVSPLLAYDGHGEGSECPHRYCGGGACPSGDADECEQPDAAPCEPDTCFAKAVDVARAVLQGAPS